ncbi:MAG: sporulation protein YunB [Bacilli bacterium]|nr:sporulation protein YunB [Bacilli bacterium]
MKKKFLKLFIIILLIIILATLLIKFLNKRIMPIYMNYQEGEMKRLITTVINKSITDDITSEFDVSELFITNTNESTKTVIIDFDPVILNRVMSSISDIVYDNLKLISEKDQNTLKKYNVSDSIFYIPTGVIFKNSVFLNNLGPKIPVKMELISSVNPNIETKVSEYGINNSLIEVFIHVNVSVRMILPTKSKEMEIVVVVPLAVKLIQGNIPENYLDNKKNS